MRSILLSFVSLFALALFSGCDSSKPTDDGAGEQEFITRLEVRLTGAGRTVTAAAVDADGDGVGIEVSGLALEAGTTYTGSIVVLDEINGEDVGAEIEEESDVHQFFFTPGGAAASRMTVTVTDRDANGLPVGLEFTLVVSAGGASTGTLNVALSHFGAEAKSGTDRSDDTDIDVTFPVTID